jgi:hypothetical protein
MKSRPIFNICCNVQKSCILIRVYLNVSYEIDGVYFKQTVQAGLHDKDCTCFDGGTKALNLSSFNFRFAYGGEFCAVLP